MPLSTICGSSVPTQSCCHCFINASTIKLKATQWLMSECTMETTKRTNVFLNGANLTWKKFLGPGRGISIPMIQSVSEFWPEDLNNLPVTRGKYEQMQGSGDTTFLKSPRQYLKASTSCAVKVRSLALCQRTPSIQKLHRGYLENVKAYDQHRLICATNTITS